METENTNIYRGTKRQRGGERRVGAEEGALCNASRRTENNTGEGEAGERGRGGGREVEERKQTTEACEEEESAERGGGGMPTIKGGKWRKNTRYN